MNRNRLGTSLWRACGAAALVVACALPAAAQTTVSSTDIQRLQDQVYEASGDISRLRGSSGDTTRLQSELDDLRDEVVYLKVKLRKEGSVSRTDYADVRDRLQDLRTRARSDSRGSDTTGWRTNSDPGTSTTTRGGTGGVSRSGGTIDDTRVEQETTRSGTSAIPVGQEIDVRLQGELSSDNAQVEQRFEATTVADLYRGNEVLIPAGSVVRGVVSSVQKAGAGGAQGQPDRLVRSGHRARPQLSDPRHRDPGHRERRHQG